MNRSMNWLARCTDTVIGWCIVFCIYSMATSVCVALWTINPNAIAPQWGGEGEFYVLSSLLGYSSHNIHTHIVRIRKRGETKIPIWWTMIKAMNICNEKMTDMWEPAPGIEPGSSAWKAWRVTARPPRFPWWWWWWWWWCVFLFFTFKYKYISYRAADKGEYQWQIKGKCA